jgi:hypothetical protein
MILHFVVLLSDLLLISIREDTEVACQAFFSHFVQPRYPPCHSLVSFRLLPFYWHMLACAAQTVASGLLIWTGNRWWSALFYFGLFVTFYWYRPLFWHGMGKLWFLPVIVQTWLRSYAAPKPSFLLVGNHAGTVIGNVEYRELPGVAHDMLNMADFVTAISAHGNCSVLSSCYSGSPLSIAGASPTKHNILNAVRRLLRSSSVCTL